MWFVKVIGWLTLILVMVIEILLAAFGAVSIWAFIVEPRGRKNVKSFREYQRKPTHFPTTNSGTGEAQT